jgi:hypothetical protein
VEFEEKLDSNLYDNIGETYEDYLLGKWVLLTDEMVSFYKNNMDATPYEVFNMKIQEEKIEERTLEVAKNEMRELILNYGSSIYVDVFYFNNSSMWLDKSTRASLKLRLDAEKQKNETQTTLWYNGSSISLSVDEAMSMLYDLEIYASKCYDNTQSQLAQIDSLETIESVDAFDYCSGYPEALNFSQNKENE